MNKIIAYCVMAVAMLATVSCNDTKSYAELLSDENKAVNSFLVNQRVVGSVPTDSVFQVGKDAPYYQMNDEGTVFMQVLNAGTKGNKATYDQLIYFRFTRYNLYAYTYDLDRRHETGYYGEFGDGEGNDSDLTFGSASFRYGNMSNNTSYQWGEGLQIPLIYLPIDCEVNVLIKSQSGLNNEISSVSPYLYKVRYFKSQI